MGDATNNLKHGLPLSPHPTSSPEGAPNWIDTSSIKNNTIQIYIYIEKRYPRYSAHLTLGSTYSRSLAK